MTKVPHLGIVIGFCVAAIVGYAAFSVYAVFYLRDATMMGDVIGTWKSFAVAAFAFWLGSSSAGKAKDGEPTPVTVENKPNSPVPTHDAGAIDDPEAKP
jgi:hypothetical protein